MSHVLLALASCCRPISLFFKFPFFYFFIFIIVPYFKQILEVYGSRQYNLVKLTGVLCFNRILVYTFRLEIKCVV